MDEHVEEISCIKDGITGACRDLKDKKARAEIEEVKEKVNEVIGTVNSLAGVDGGHLATDEDINNLDTKVTGDITALTERVTAIENSSSEVDLSGYFKIPEKDTGGFTLVPSLNTYGEVVYKRLSSLPLSNDIACYNINGNLKTNTPTEYNEVANKQYVDNAVANAGGSVDTSNLVTKEEFNNSENYKNLNINAFEYSITYKKDEGAIYSGAKDVSKTYNPKYTDNTNTDTLVNNITVNNIVEAMRAIVTDFNEKIANAGGSEKALYQHSILIKDGERRYSCIIINNIDTAMDQTAFKNYLNDNGFSSADNILALNGIAKNFDGTKEGELVGVYAATAGTVIMLQFIAANVTENFIASVSNPYFYDTVTKVL